MGTFEILVISVPSLTYTPNLKLVRADLSSFQLWRGRALSWFTSWGESLTSRSRLFH